MLRRTLKVVLLITALLVCLCVLNSCTKNPVTVTGLPAGVSNQAVNSWITAAQDLDKAYSVTHAAKEAVIGARNSGDFTNDTAYAKALTGVGRALQLEAAAADALKKQPNDWGKPLTGTIESTVNEALTALTDVINAGTVGIKNPTTQKTVLGIINSGVQILQLVLSLSSQPVAMLPGTFLNTYTEDSLVYESYTA